MYMHVYFEQSIHHLDSPDWAEFEQYLEDGWKLEEPIFISEDVKKQIASSSLFSTIPIERIKEHVVAKEFHNLMSPAFAISISYIVNICRDAAHLRRLLDEFNQPQPSILCIHILYKDTTIYLTKSFEQRKPCYCKLTGGSFWPSLKLHAWYEMYNQ